MKTISMKLSMAALAAAMVAAPAVNVFAAPDDIIDTTRKANLTIHKYDITAAEEDNGVGCLDQFKPTGKQDAAAEKYLERYPIGGVEFSYMKVGAINTDSDGGKIQVLYDMPKQLQTILGLTGGKGDQFTSDQINKALEGNLINNSSQTKNALEKYMSQGEAKKFQMTSDEDGVAEADNLDLGLYLIVETKVPANVHTTVDPFFVSLPMTDMEGSNWFYDVHVYPKNQTNIPNLDKLVRQNDDAASMDADKKAYHNMATASEGDKVDYILVSHLPRITTSATYLTEYTFTDTRSRGTKYNGDATIYFYDNEADAKANNTSKAVTTWDNKSGKFSVEKTGGEGATGTLKFSVTKEGFAELNPGNDWKTQPGLSDKWMVVYYSLDMNSDDSPILGDTGNTNDVKLVWRRTNMDKPDELEDRARVFTYGINLTKQFQKDGQTGTTVADATKVKFSLRNVTDGHFVTATSKPSSGIYYVTDSVKGQKEADIDNAPVPGEENVVTSSIFSPAADGKLLIHGLEADEYELVEMQTVPGFNLLKEPIRIKIDCTQVDFTPSQTTLYDKDDIKNNADMTNGGHRKLIESATIAAKATVDGKATAMSKWTPVTNNEGIDSVNAKVDMVITNTPGFKLPATGGAGTIAFTVAGCAVAFAGIAFLTKKSNKEDK